MDLLLEAVRVTTQDAQANRAADEPEGADDDEEAGSPGIDSFGVNTSPPAKRRGSRKKSTRCLSCSKWKVKCSRSLPCERCFNLCLRCQPPSLEEGKPFLDIIMTTAHPEIFNDAFLKTFYRLHGEGRLDREKWKSHMRLWRTMAKCARIDITYGLFDEVCTALRIGEAEILDGIPGEGLVHEGVFDLNGRSLVDRAVGLSARLAATQEFQRMDDGCSMLVVAALMPHDIAIAMNDVAAKLFCSTDEALGYLRLQKMLPVHTLAALVAPDDRPLLYEFIFWPLNKDCYPRTTFVKFCERSGDIALYILRTRSLKVEAFSHAHAIVALTIERAPSSRHITRRPGHHHHIVEQYRQETPAPPADEAGEDHDGTGGAARRKVQVPGLGFACLPVKQIPLDEVQRIVETPDLEMPPPRPATAPPGQIGRKKPRS